MEKTCKECEHYEFYDGPKKSFMGTKAIMKCISLTRRQRVGKEDGEDMLYDAISLCDCFTPKKPEEERTCDTCKFSKRNTGRYCWDKFPKKQKECSAEIGYLRWQPIPKEKPDQAAISLGTFKAGEPTPAIDPKHKWTGIEWVEWDCKDCQLRALPLYAEPCRSCPGGSDYKPISKSNPTPKPKENKMNRLKKWIRRYVMGCTLYCTAVICIALNPWVCKLWNSIMPPVHQELDSFVNIAMNWFLTLISIAIVIAAIYAFEKATAFIFGKLEK